MSYNQHKIFVPAIFLMILTIQITFNDAKEEETLEYQNPSLCKSYEIFNTTSLSCGLCNFTQNLEPSKSRFHCVCNKNSKIIGFENGVPLCEPCKNRTVVTLDGMHCIKCQHNSKKCSCLPNEIQIEKNVSGNYLEYIQCFPCPANMYPSFDKTRCVTNTRFLYGQLTKLRSSAMKNINQSILNVDSHVNQVTENFYLYTELQIALILCKNESSVACEHLANMCTLSMFTNKIMCDLFLNNLHGQMWLFYRKEENNKILKNDVPMKYSLKGQDDNSRINISIISHKLNGEFVSIDKPNLLCEMLGNIRFGININKNCVVTAQEFLSKETLFYTPYLTFREEEKLLLHNIPVLVKNINKSENISEWQLVKKFILVDTVSGLALSNNTQANALKSSIRYLQSLSITLPIQGNNQNKIYSPLIEVYYGILTEDQILANQKIYIKYDVQFVIKTNNIDKIIKIIIAVCSGLAILYAMLKTWSYCKRDHLQKLHALVIMQFLIFSCSLVGNVLMIVSVCTCIYIFILYKGQTVFHIPLPSAQVEQNIKIYIIIAFAFKSIEVMNFVYQFRNVNLFFVDWEQPKTIYTRYLKGSSFSPIQKPRQKRRRLSTPTSSVKKKKRFSSLRANQFSDSRENLSIIYKPRENLDVVEYQANEMPVSIWRTYFIAKEWFELQTIRKISLLLHTICILFVLEVIGVKYYSCAIPELSLETDEKLDYNLILHHGIGTLIYIIFYILQWLNVILFYEKCVNNKVQHFVDICSIANISVFIFVYKYYGFYIHGRSVHGFADTDLQSLANDLQKEENNLCAHRGLVPGTVDQTFIVSLSPSFQYFYDKLFNEQNNEILHETSGFLTWQRDFQAHLRVKKFLTGFIDHCFYEMDYIIKDRFLLEKLLDIEFQNPTDKTIFRTDYTNSFDIAIMYGNEWTLGTFEMTLFIFVLCFSRDYIISSLSTLLVSQILIAICKCNGKKTLAKKTLLDDRLIT